MTLCYEYINIFILSLWPKSPGAGGCGVWWFSSLSAPEKVVAEKPPSAEVYPLPG
jgi:hypothetical protein